MMKSLIVFMSLIAIGAYATIQCDVCEGIVAFARTEIEINKITNPAQAMAKLQALCEAGDFPFLDPSECALFLEHFGTEMVADLLNDTLTDCQMCVNFQYCATSDDCSFTRPQQRCLEIAVDLMETKRMSGAQFRDYVKNKCGKRPNRAQ